MNKEIPEETNNLDEGLIRMIESGWILHRGEVTESDIKTHEFNTMGDNTFKKLKEVDDEKNVD